MLEKNLSWLSYYIKLQLLAADTGLHHQRWFEKKLSYLTQTCFVDVFVHMWCILSRFLLCWIGVYDILLYHLIQCCRIWNDNVSHFFFIQYCIIKFSITVLQYLIFWYKRPLTIIFRLGELCNILLRMFHC